MTNLTDTIVSDELSKLGIEAEKPKAKPVAKTRTRKTEIQATMFDDMPAIPDFLDRRTSAPVDARDKKWTPKPKPTSIKPERGDLKARLDSLRLQFVAKSGQADAVIEKDVLEAMAAEITTEFGDMLECCGLIYSTGDSASKLRQLLMDFMTMHTKHYNGQMYRYVCVVQDAE